MKYGSTSNSILLVVLDIQATERHMLLLHCAVSPQGFSAMDMVRWARLVSVGLWAGMDERPFVLLTLYFSFSDYLIASTEIKLGFLLHGCYNIEW